MQSGFQVQWNGDTIAHTRPYKSVFLYNGSGSTIAQYAAVEWDTTVDPPGGGTNTGRSTIKTKAASATAKFVGAAVYAIPTGTWGEVCVQGECSVATTGAPVAGDMMAPTTATAGVLAVAGGTATIDSTGNVVVGRAMGAPVSNVTVVELFNVYGL